MSDSDRDHNPLEVVRALPANWGYIFRHYDHPNRRALAKRVAKICQRRGIILLVGSDWKLAREIGADGIHMPEGVIKNTPASPYVLQYRTKIITTSAHDRTGLRAACNLPIKAVLLSPIYRTLSHPKAKPIGTMGFAAFVRLSSKPMYALGGVKRGDLKRLRALGVLGIAGISLARS